MTTLEKDFAFTLELIGLKDTNWQGIDYYLVFLNYEYEDLSKEQEQALVQAIRANPSIRTPEHHRHYLHYYRPSRDKSFLAPETWLPDPE